MGAHMAQRIAPDRQFPHSGIPRRLHLPSWGRFVAGGAVLAVPTAGLISTVSTAQLTSSWTPADFVVLMFSLLVGVAVWGLLLLRPPRAAPEASDP
jgi:hypothetical protein